MAARSAVRERLRAAYLRPRGERPASAAHGIYHTALISSDGERTIRFDGLPITLRAWEETPSSGRSEGLRRAT